MIGKVTESRMHLVRWLLVVGWLALILSAFYDPISYWLTDPQSLWSPLHVNLDRCILVQGQCLSQSSYVLAPRIFWGIVVPLGVIILLVGGHEAWRRICPLYFISQIPRRLGLQRKRSTTNPETGAVRQELVGIGSESWLGKNYGYLQFFLLFVGLNLRLLVANGNGLGFGLFVLSSIAAALTVGYLFKGRTWCHYFCPMAPVQILYTSNRGLLGSDAHLSPPASITQSMCRSSDGTKEKSACVSCQSPCLDIDAERTYWTNLERPDRQLLFYGYFGLMLSFFSYFYLYAGNWDYYFSGAWSHDAQQFSSLLGPGFYLQGQAIGIPKLLAVPLVLALGTLASYGAGLQIERWANWANQRRQRHLSNSQVRHLCFVGSVFLSFNVFFIFAGRSNFKLLPPWVELVFNALIILISTLWLQHNFHRSQSLYQRESLTGSLRRQLQKLAINWSEFLEGRSLNDLATAEVYVLAKVLPGFNRQSRLQVYQGVLQEALNEGKTQSANSLEMLQGMREELQVTEDEHYSILANLGVEDPNLLDPQVQRSREDRLRLDSYQQNLEELLLDLISSGGSIEQALQQKRAKIESMRQEYGVSNEEQEQVLLALFHPEGTLLETSAKLLKNLQQWSTRYQTIVRHATELPEALYKILHSTIQEQQRLLVSQLFSILEILADDRSAKEVAASTGYLAPEMVRELLSSDPDRLSAAICKTLMANSPPEEAPKKSVAFDTLDETIIFAAHSKITQIGRTPAANIQLVEVLQGLLAEVDPLVKAVSLHAMQQLNSSLASNLAQRLDNNCPPLVQETVNRVLQRPAPARQIPTLTLDLRIYNRQERQVYAQSIVRLGRATSNDVVILDNQISRQHALFTIDEHGIMLRDLGSTNGLHFGNTHLKNAEQPLPSGTEVMLCASNNISVIARWSMVNRPGDNITTVEKLLWLSSNKFFKDCSCPSLLDLAHSSNLQVFDKGQEICVAGQPATNLLLMIAGSVNVNDHILGPGNVLGEVGILTRNAYSHTVIAHSPKVPILVISAHSFNDLLERDSRVARALLASISQRLQ
jgi:FHA domain/Cyclic nucleotide-binding domain